MKKNAQEHIAEITKVVRHHDWNNNHPERESLGGESPYIEMIQKAYDHFPPLLQNVLLKLKRIYIESDMKMGGYAQLYRNSPGATIGLRKLDLDLYENLGKSLSKKEQLSYGLCDSTEAIDHRLPHYISEERAVVHSYLYYVLAHEIGHLVDWKNGFTNFESSGFWSETFWECEERPKKDEDFVGRNLFRFYQAKPGDIQETQSSSLYQRLYESNFISAYGSTNADDDFAESFANVVLLKQLKTKLVLSDGKDKTYDIVEKINSKRFSTKKEFIEKILDSADLILP